MRTPSIDPHRFPWLRLGVALAATALMLAAPGGLALAGKPAAGKPTFKAGDPEAFYVWFDNAGWHLRATAQKGTHTFHGVLRATGGMTAVKPSRPGLLKRIEVAGGSISFDFELGAGGEGGFDWQQTDDCLTAELKLDQRVDASRIRVGLAGHVPEAVPFLACR